jgi:two-component system CheB/CheR fusion protein
MVELLARQTPMRVLEAEDGMRVEPDSVYVIPPNRYLAIRGRALHLSELPKARVATTAIDPFFESLAEDQRDRAIGIILSGTGSHGTKGLREIKLAGGMVMAQSPESAGHDQMPRNAVATGLVDYVLPPEEMPAALLGYARHPYMNGSKIAPDSPEMSDFLARVLTLYRSSTRFAPPFYRKEILLRRIERRMGLHQLDDYSSYLKLLRESPEEVNALSGDLLIRGTGFFREPEAFDALSRKVIVEVVDRAAAQAPIRAWVAGCATGEEAYSIAILIMEALHGAGKKTNLQLFATDASQSAIQVARRGIYSQSVASNVGPERLERFFIRLDQDRYQVTKSLRQSCVFAVQNVASDAPFSKMDLVSCRNLLAFLEPETREKLTRLFRFALNANGYLFLGPRESVGRSKGFEPVSRKWRIYRAAGPIRKDEVALEVLPERRRQAPRSVDARKSPIRWMKRQLLAEHSPAAALVDDSFRTLGYHGPIGNYLEIPSGAPTRDLLSMSRPGLRSHLRIAVQRAARKNEKIETTDCRVKRDGKFMPCVITVSPVNQEHERRLYLVTFREEKPPSGAPRAARSEESVLVKHLERDLKATREDLQSVIEELETSNEELSTTNEEVASMNEELQSSNEELETSKEELRSINDELNTVNHRLQDKVGELERLHDDLVNLMSSTEIAVLFLDPEQKIKRFSPAASRLLNLLPSDAGRPLRQLSFPFADDTLLEDNEQVTEHLVPMEKDVRTLEGRFYLRRVLPYRAAGRQVAGTVVTFVEITARKRAEAALADLNKALERRVGDRTTELETAQTELARSHETLRSLWARLLSAEDMERRRISRELHDDFSQRLAMLSVDLESLKGSADLTERISERLEKMTETAAILSEDLRQLAYSLHPSILDHLGLSAALQRYIDEFSSLHGIRIMFRQRGIDGKIDPAIAACFYRVAQEALTNVARHSGSPRSTVHLMATPSAFRLSVLDFGKGFDVLGARKGIKTLGLVSMEERVRFLGGELRIRSIPGVGTFVRATCPRPAPGTTLPGGGVV